MNKSAVVVPAKPINNIGRRLTFPTSQIPNITAITDISPFPILAIKAALYQNQIL